LFLVTLGWILAFAPGVFATQTTLIQNAGTGESTRGAFRDLVRRQSTPDVGLRSGYARVPAVNDAAVHHYGYTREEFLQIHDQDIRPANEVEHINREIGLDSRPTNPNRDPSRYCKKTGPLSTFEVAAHQFVFAGRTPTRAGDRCHGKNAGGGGEWMPSTSKLIESPPGRHGEVATGVLHMSATCSTAAMSPPRLFRRIEDIQGLQPVARRRPVRGTRR